MDTSTELVNHYAPESPIERIQSQLRSAGIDLAALTVSDLAGVDEFHLGGKLATTAILEHLPSRASAHHLDIGCGIGGAARTIAATTGCAVTGIDLTPGFVATAERLSGLVGMSDQTSFALGNASTIDFPDGHFDSATLLHVGMNIEDKQGLFNQVEHVLRPGGVFVVYDIMRIGDGDLDFPMPWSSVAASSFVETPERYVGALESAGFTTTAPVNRMELVARALAAAVENPPAVDLSHLMGSAWPEMFANLRSALQAQTLAPVQITGTTSEL